MGLGRFTRTETIAVNLANGTFTGTLVFTAANGDRLSADIAGRFTSPTGDSAEGTYVFTGGTGRFQNALGQAAFEATADGLAFDVTFKGTIQYLGPFILVTAAPEDRAVCLPLRPDLPASYQALS